MSISPLKFSETGSSGKVACLIYQTFKQYKGMKKGLQSRMHSRVRSLTKIALLMKLAFSIVLITCLQASATGYSQEARLSLDMRSVTIGKVLKTIEVRTDYHFVYSSDLFPVNSLVNISVKEKPVSDILNLVLEKTGFTFRNVDDLIILTSNRVTNAQQELRGRVTASTTGEPLAGATVSIENTGISTATQLNIDDFDICRRGGSLT